METIIKDVSGDGCRSAFLIMGEEPVLYDTGMAYGAAKTIENIKRELDGAPLMHVLLSHSHYDHVAGLPFLREEWPGLKSYGSAYAKKILEKPSARKTMRELSDAAAKGAGLPAAPEYDEDGLDVDVVVGDGDELVLGSHRILVYETPGHTRCALSYLVDRDLLFASETVGVFTDETYMPCYLVGYQMSVDSVRKLKKAPAKRIFITHGESCRKTRTFRPKNLGIFCRARELLGMRSQDKGRDHRNHKNHPHERGADGRPCWSGTTPAFRKRRQPDFAFLLNAAATLDVVRRECMERRNAAGGGNEPDCCGRQKLGHRKEREASRLDPRGSEAVSGRDHRKGHRHGQENHGEPSGRTAPLRTDEHRALTRNPDYRKKGAKVVHSVDETLELLKDVPTDDIFIIGGAEIYEQFLPYCDTAHVTWIDYAYEADTYFVNLEKDPGWELTAESDEQTYFNICYEFRRYERKQK